jgi:hypothetical protein
MKEPVEPSKGQDLLPGLNDPPALRALLLAAGKDGEVRAQIARAYYGVMEGSKFSPSVLHAILLSAIYNAILVHTGLSSSSASNGNGKQPGQPKASQLEAIALSLKSLPSRADIASRQDFQALQQQLSQMAESLLKNEQDRQKHVPELRTISEDLKFAAGKINKKLRAAGQAAPDTTAVTWCKRGAFALGAAIIAFGLGYFICLSNLQKDMDTRLDRLVDAQPAAASVPLFLAAHGGSIFIGPVKGPDGKERRGVIIEPGLLGKPFISTTDAAVIPIP